jgi:uncharacterized protein (TIGR03084 family)
MKEVLAALAAQQAELDALLTPLDAAGWTTPAPQCPGWTVHDVVLHLAQTDEAGAASAEDQLGRAFAGVRGEGGPSGTTVDDLAGFMVEQERDVSDAQVHHRWRAAAAAQGAALARRAASDRVQWVNGDMAARTLATTRLSETWIHTGDVADALGLVLAPTDRLRHIARLAWRTLPYAFARAGRTLQGAVAVTLTGPDGSTWEFTPDEPAPTRLEGPAEDFCLVAGRRREPSQTALLATGPDAAAVLELVRTYA